MARVCTLYSVHQCSMCLGDTAYYCVSCPCDLCPQCKENHVKDLQTIDHDVVTYLNKNPGDSIKPDTFEISKTVYHQIKATIFYRSVLLQRIKSDTKICQSTCERYQSKMSMKAQVLKKYSTSVLRDMAINHRCVKQKMEINQHISCVQKYENKYEESGVLPIQFLVLIKKLSFSKIKITHHTNFLIIQSLKKEVVRNSLTKIKIIDGKIRQIKPQSLLTLLSSPEFHHMLTVKDVDRCLHISCMAADRVCVSEKNNLVITNNTGTIIHKQNDLYDILYRGLHTVKNNSELIYIDTDFNIRILSEDMKKTKTVIRTRDSKGRPHCLHWSISTGDLLVGMYNEFPITGKVARFNPDGKLTQTIQYSNQHHDLYKGPNYITENNNGDVVVSDSLYGSGAVVVTDRGGRHRFSYKGRLSGSRLWPCGICTDALSHILVCDIRTDTVQMLHKDGHFLSHLLIRPLGIFRPNSLSYDVTTHRLWVGSRYKNKLCIYRYINNRKDVLTATNNLMKIPKPHIEEKDHETKHRPKQMTGPECLLKPMFPPELLTSFKMTDICGCVHISCVTTDLVSVSDSENNLILTNTTGVTLHRVENLCRDLYRCYGVHTVNREGELFYIDEKFNISKLSNDMKKNSEPFVSIASTERPQCVYWSQSTEDLLIGMSDKVTRYNKSGQLTETIQHDKTGLELYDGIHYITENINGDVVVSDFGAVVVTERGGKHRFSYTGHPPGTGLRPMGICSDELSNILLCDNRTHTVQMLNCDGQLLSKNLISSIDIDKPHCLSYNLNTRCFLVGSSNKNEICVVCFRIQLEKETENDEVCIDEDVRYSSRTAAK